MSLDERAAASGHDLDSIDFAKSMDAADELHKFRSEFHKPLHSDGTEQVYLTGNSLGLQPKSTAAAVTAELQKWAAIGVGGHFTGDLPWAQCEEKLPELLGEVVGAEDAELEVAAMNTLTVNLHMLMAAFYRPSGERSTTATAGVVLGLLWTLGGWLQTAGLGIDLEQEGQRRARRGRQVAAT